MYRQLLHTHCKPGLQLSRKHEGTDALNAKSNTCPYVQTIPLIYYMTLSLCLLLLFTSYLFNINNAIAIIKQNVHHITSNLHGRTNNTHHCRPTLQNRWYRGESGEPQSRPINDDDITKREEALYKIAQPKADQIFDQRIRQPSVDNVPSSSLPSNLQDCDLSKEELELEVRKLQLIYRSKQRGWLEVDLLLGSWASENVPLLTDEELEQFENFVNMETLDIYNIVTLRSDVPDDLKTGRDGNGIVERDSEMGQEYSVG